MLRKLGHPVRLFGESVAEVRERLREILARSPGARFEALCLSFGLATLLPSLERERPFHARFVSRSSSSSEEEDALEALSD